MAFVTGSWWFDVIIALIVILVAFDFYQRRNRNFWKTRSVAFNIMPNTYLLLARFVRNKKHIAVLDKEEYDKLTGHKFGGSFEFHRPYLILRDPEIIKNVLVKDFNHFVNRRKFEAFNDEFFGNMLSVLADQEWKDMRTLISPTFTSGKIKSMFDALLQCTDLLQVFLDDKIKENDGDIIVDECFERFAAQVIASIAFGMDASAFDKSSEFLHHAKLLQRFDKLLMIKFLLFLTFPSLSKKFKIQIFKQQPIDFFTGQIKAVIKHREETGEVRNDFLQLLLQARKGDLEDDRHQDDDQYDRDARLDHHHDVKKTAVQNMTDDSMYAQTFLFIFAGFDSISSLLSVAAYELALHPEIQDRLVGDIDNTFGDGKVTYQKLQELEYLDMVVSETLRKYPLAPRLDRVCGTDYTIPGTDITIEKGTLIFIPAYAIQHDEQFYPEPEKFDPERFSPEEKKKRSPYLYLPFGQGPRNCIGMRFALLEAKIAIVNLLRNYELSPCVDTQIPLTLDWSSAFLKGAGGIKLNFKPRSI